MNRFEECFGDLPKETQKKLRNTLNAMIKIINKELSVLPIMQTYDTYEIIQLKRIEEVNNHAVFRTEKGFV